MNELTIATYRPTYATLSSDAVFGQSTYSDPLTLVDITDTIVSYGHDTSAVGGYDSARVQLVQSIENLKFWLSSGVGRDVRVYGSRGEEVWRGFVDLVSAQVGDVRFERGPYLEIANYVRVKYTTKRWDVVPPVGGEEALTDWASDQASVSRYGVLREILSGGEGTETEMEQMRDQYLAAHARPQGNVTVSAGQSGSGQVTLELELKGYIHRLRRMTYENETSGETDTSDVVDDAIDPTEMPWVEIKRIEANSTQTGQYYPSRKARTIESVVKEKAEKADSGDLRYVYGFYANGVFVYESIPTQVEYIYSTDRGVITKAGSDFIVPHASVEPAKWLYISGPLGDSSYPSGLDQLRASHNAIFIERVSFTYPNGLELNGIKLDSLKEQLDSMGLGSNVK